MCDGDILLTVKNKTLNNIVRRNKDKIAPLYFEMKKADPQELNPENIYNGIVSSFKYGKIGIYSNAISKIWNKEELTQEDLDVIKLLVAESNWSIDAAKTLYMPERPEKARQDITQRTKYKLPAFFEYAKDKTKSQCEGLNNSTMNRVSSAIADRPIRFSKSLSKFEYRRLLSDMGFELTADSYRVLERYDYWNKRQKLVFNSDENKNANDGNYAFLKIKSNITDETGLDIDFIVNSLVTFLYKDRPQSTKKLLWSCFGEVLVKNLKKNTEGLGKICQVCGKRFKPNRGEQNLYCSTECYEEAHRQKSLERWREQN